ncbi:MAG: hypothetical protein NC225_02920 [Clostridium sp.]|nr:hypothetical protein [Clostridium sp.]MCM1398417.1 hypothetical protein [Clostridium sp.]MCM1458918.1 hypothetical protein [Bacteroides sp.]
MGKVVKRLLKITVTAAAVGGLCYAFKDKIRESKVYQEHNVDEKIKKVTTAIKEKLPISNENEEDFVEEDEIFFEDITPAERDYVSINQDEQPVAEAADTEATGTETAKDEETADDKADDVPTIDV